MANLEMSRNGNSNLKGKLNHDDDSTSVKKTQKGFQSSKASAIGSMMDNEENSEE